MKTINIENFYDNKLKLAPFMDKVGAREYNWQLAIWGLLVVPFLIVWLCAPIPLYIWNLAAWLLKRRERRDCEGTGKVYD